MGKIASKYADKIIITSDNSRDEDTLDIIKEIFSGVEEEKMCYIIPNRRDAITFAINQLDNESILLLLGKGHEKYEIINGSMQYFNEKEIVREACIKFNLLKQKK
jgi:UDP-N-acetylmuramoyl-L-alanyl-D-glutamate--2,6-diaminopimelate ligase